MTIRVTPVLNHFKLKIWFSEFHPLLNANVLFCRFLFIISPCVWPNSGFWCCIFLTLPRKNIVHVGVHLQCDNPFWFPLQCDNPFGVFWSVTNPFGYDPNSFFWGREPLVPVPVNVIIIFLTLWTQTKN